MKGTSSHKDLLRERKLPFCPGCGIFTVMNLFLKAVNELGHKDFRKFVFCSGIGCSSWIPSPYFKADSIHTPHGRSIPVATGVKSVRPDLCVVVFGGDGDITGIGMSHFIHAARRNLDILVIMINNMVYGMTGGQVAPTTPVEMKTSTTPYGNRDRPLDAAALAVTAGAAYSARWTTAHPMELKESIKKAIEMKGYRFIEIVSQCPTAFGKRAGFKNIAEILKWFKQKSIFFQHSKKISRKQLEKRIIVGEFVGGKGSSIIEQSVQPIKGVDK
jgi:2-oxoglutarate ferredoxin oxidoreductase subunit beta